MLTVEEAKERFRGVVVPLATIFTDDGSLDTDATAANAQWIIDQGGRQGNTIFLVAGSGGDFSVLSTEERKQVIKSVAEVSGGRVPTVAGVQSTDIRVAIELCQFCEEAGIDAAQMSAAYYYDVKAEDAIAWHEEVARHTKVSFAAYNHFYSGSKYDMPADVAERLLDIPNTVVVKWGSPSVANFYDGVRRLLPRAAVVDNSLMPVLGHKLGCRAWISHVPNFYPQHSWKVGDLLEEGRYEEAQQLYDAFMLPYFELAGQIQQATAGEGVFVKPFMEAVGLRGGHSRLPSRDAAVTQEVREGIRKLMAQGIADG